MDKTSKREFVRQLAGGLSRERRDFKIKTFRAMQRLPLPGWKIKK
jgi:hypothetical protein